MRIESLPPAKQATDRPPLAGVLIETEALGRQEAQALATQFGLPAVNALTLAVPAASIVQALQAQRMLQHGAPASAAQAWLDGRPWPGIHGSGAFGMPPLLASAPPAKPPLALSEQQTKQLIGIARAATAFFAHHVWPNPAAKTVVTAGWLAYDAYRLADTWNDSKKTTLACMVDTSKVALDTFALLDSHALFGATPLLGGDAKTMLSTALTVIGDAESGKDGAIAALDLAYDRKVKSEAAAGDEAVEGQWAMLKLGARIAEAALSTDPACKDFRLMPIPHQTGST